MNDPLNQLPVDPEWLARVNRITEDAAKELGCMVLVVAIQEQGKLAVDLAGVPTSGPLVDIAAYPPRLLLHLAGLTAQQDMRAAREPKQ